MKYEIIIKILFLLLTRKRVTSSYIASRYEISRRTAMRYLNELSLAGIPLISENGRYGGYYIADTFKLPSTFLTPKELELTLSTLISHNNEISSEELASAIDKLASLKRSDVEQLEIKSGHLIIDGSSWTGSNAIRSTVALMEKGIENNLKVNICYRDKKGEVSERTVEPHTIILKQGLWYVYAFCNLRGQFRLFKMGRICHATLTDLTFEKREVLPEQLNLNNLFDQIPSENIDMIAEMSAKSDLEEWLGVENVNERADGKLSVSACLPVDDRLVSDILRFSGDVRIIAPEKLKRMVASAAKKIAENYQ